MQGLHDKFKDKGLVVLAPHCQDADRDKLEVFALKHGITYPVGMKCDTSGYPGQGIPRAAVIGVDGTVLWQGNPNGGSVEKLIEAEIPKVDMWGERGLVKTQKGIATKLMQRKLGAAHAELKKLAPDGGTAPTEVQTALTRLEAYQKGLLDRALKAQEAGDFGRATELATECEKTFKGSDLEAGATKFLEELKKVDGYDKGMKAFRAWQQLEKKAADKPKDAAALAKSVASAFGDTYYGKRAEVVARMIESSK